MPIMRKVMETVARFVPDGEPDPLIHKHGHVGKPVSRIDGLLKVKGGAGDRDALENQTGALSRKKLLVRRWDSDKKDRRCHIRSCRQREPLHDSDHYRL